MRLNRFPEFKHFLECYFNMSADFSDLKHLAFDYKQCESKDSVNALVMEIHTISALKDHDEVKTIIKEYGMRRLSDEKTREMLSILLTNLT